MESRRALPADVVLDAWPRQPGAVLGRPAVVCLPSGETRLPFLTLARRGTPGRYAFGEDLDGDFVGTWQEPSS